MQKSYKKISWLEMLRALEDLGYYYTADCTITPRGYKRGQLFFKMYYHHRPGLRPLTAAELRTALDHKITVLCGRSEYAPEQRFFIVSNKLYPGGVL